MSRAFIMRAGGKPYSVIRLEGIFDSECAGKAATVPETYWR